MYFESESELSRELSARLVARGALVIAKVGNYMEQSGWPDRFVAHRVYNGWLEMKRDQRELTPSQRDLMQGMLARRTRSCVVRYESSWGELTLGFPLPGV